MCFSFIHFKYNKKEKKQSHFKSGKSRDFSKTFPVGGRLLSQKVCYDFECHRLSDGVAVFVTIMSLKSILSIFNENFGTDIRFEWIGRSLLL